MRTQSVQPMRTQGLVQPMRTQWLVQPITCTPSTPWHALPALMVFLPGLVEFFCTYFSSICRSSIGRLIFFVLKKIGTDPLVRNLLDSAYPAARVPVPVLMARVPVILSSTCPDGQSTCPAVQSTCPSDQFMPRWPVSVLLTSNCPAFHCPEYLSC